MWLTRFSVMRPVTATMASLLVVILGLTALSRLAVDLMPNVTYPTVSVSTLYEGAGPTEVETLITHPLEQALSSVQGVQRIESTSSEGASNISVTFNWGVSLDTAVADLRAAIEKNRRRLPKDCDIPSIRKYSAADSPVVILGLASRLPARDLTRLAETQIIPALEAVRGVAAARLRGEVRREIQVNIDRTRLESLNLGINEVVDALRNENVNLPSGVYDEGQFRRGVRSEGEFRSLQEIGGTVIRRNGGAEVHVHDVAEVIDGLEEQTQRTRINGQPGIILYVNKQSDANTVAVSDRIHKAVATLNARMQHAELVVRIDKAQYIRQSIANIRESTLHGMVLTIVVLIVFLQNFRSTLVIALSMPISLVGTFAMMYFQGFTLNIVSFGGLALGIGMLVDNSIVVLESIFIKLENGLPPQQAAIEGTNEVAVAVMASTATSLVVFVPLLFVEGITGVLLHQLALVITYSLLISLFTSLTLTPVLAAYWLPRELALPLEQRPRSWVNVLHRANNWWVTRLERGYEWSLRRALKFAGTVSFLVFLVFSLSLGMIPRIGTELMPRADEGDISIDSRMAAGTQLATLDRQTHIIEEKVLNEVPERTMYGTFVGDSAENADSWNESRIRLMLVPRSQRQRSADQIRRDLEARIGEVPGMTVNVRTLSGMSLGSVLSFGDGDLQIQIRGHDLAVSHEIAQSLEKMLQRIPGIVNLRIPRLNHRPELAVRINRRKASQMGVTVRDIAQTLETTIRGTEATKFRDQGDEFNVLVRLREQDRSSLADMEQLSFTTPQRKRIPLKNLIEFDRDEAAVNISRVAQQRCITVSMYVDGRDFGSVVADINRGMAGIPLPEGYSLAIAGGWEQQQESFQMLRWGFLLALALMYMVMAAQYESFRDPFLILLAVPLAATGVIGALLVSNTTLNVQSFIGIIMLSGIVVNNAIVLIDYMNQLRVLQPRLSLNERVVLASVRRLRPILMTSLTTILAMIPLALAWGEGGEMEAPLARVVVGGLGFGNLVTLFAIPIAYRFAERWRRDRGEPAPALLAGQSTLGTPSPSTAVEALAPISPTAHN